MGPDGAALLIVIQGPDGAALLSCSASCDVTHLSSSVCLCRETKYYERAVQASEKSLPPVVLAIANFLSLLLAPFPSVCADEGDFFWAVWLSAYEATVGWVWDQLFNTFSVSLMLCSLLTAFCSSATCCRRCTTWAHVLHVVCCLSQPQEKCLFLQSEIYPIYPGGVCCPHPDRTAVGRGCIADLRLQPQEDCVSLPVSEDFSLIYCCDRTSDMTVPSPFLWLHKTRRALVRPNHSQNHSLLQEAFCSFPVTPTDLIVEVSAGIIEGHSFGRKRIWVPSIPGPCLSIKIPLFW